MKPGCFDWPDQYAGDTAEWLEFSIFEDGAPIILLGAVIKMQVRKSHKATPIIEVTSVADDGIEITDALGGIFRVGGYQNPDVSAIFIYDIEFTYPSGEVFTYLHGQYPIYPQVTK